MRLQVHRGAVREYVDLDTGRAYYSVSQVLAWLDGRLRAETATPSAALQRGTLLHRYWALTLGTHAGLCAPPPPLAGEADICRQLGQWTAQTVAVPLLIEESRAHATEPYAGTLDAIVQLRDGRTVLLDLKTGQPTVRDQVQVTAYSRLDGLPPLDAVGLLYAHPGGVRVEWVPAGVRMAHWTAFTAALRCLEWHAIYGQLRIRTIT